MEVHTVPPLWVIICILAGIAIHQVFWRGFVQPRSTKYVVEGRDVFVPRRREQLLQAALLVGMFLAFMAVGALVEGNLLFVVVGIPFVIMMAIGLSRAPKAPEGVAPSRGDVKKAQDLARAAVTALVLAVMEPLVIAAGVAVGGVPGIILLVLGTALTVAAAWHTWRIVKIARRKTSDDDGYPGLG